MKEFCDFCVAWENFEREVFKALYIENITMDYKETNRYRKLESRQKRMKKHGKNIGVIYKNALEKRATSKERI